jgi:hypothetical protein
VERRVGEVKDVIERYFMLSSALTPCLDVYMSRDRLIGEFEKDKDENIEKE